MSPTLDYQKTNNRKIDILLNNSLHINNNFILNNNLIFESMPDLQPILNFDGTEEMDEIDDNIISDGNHSEARLGDTDGRPQNSPKNEFKATEAVVRKQAPAFLLIESLIWNFCCSNETDRQKQRLLFHSLCRQLNGLKLIGNSYKSDSLQPIREFIVKKFNELILQIRTQDKRLKPLMSSNSPRSNQLVNCAHLIHQSRYRDDFEDLGLIEAGGFGVVNKAKYRFDDCEYAVKMIRFKYTDKYDTVFKKIIREVQLYANLSSHPNVVAYKTAWLENWCLHREPLPLSNTISNGGDNQISNGMDDIFGANRTAKDNENDFSIRFEESSKSGIRIESSDQQMSEDIECNQTIEMEYREDPEDDGDDEDNSSEDENSSDDSNDSKKTFKMQSLSDLSVIKHSVVRRKKTISMSSTQSQSDSAVEYRDCFQLQSYRTQNIPEIKVDDYQLYDCPFSCSDFGAILYIQMELCGKNLKTWLRERNDTVFTKYKECKQKSVKEKQVLDKTILDLVNKTEALNIFRQVLKGVEYIHSQHLIHRDLKPQNILFSIDGSKVKIGDFGLATLHNSIIDSDVISFDLFSQTIPSASNADPTRPDLNHTGNIGTSIYASPEQKCRKDYDNKTDLFSLGIILFELFYPISTEMEKANCVSDITKKQKLPEKLVNSCPKVAKIIMSMTHPNPIMRPTAADVLHSSLFLTDEQMVIKQIEDQNKQIINDLVLKDNRIKELENSLQTERRLTAEKDKEIEKLRKQLEVMNEKIKFFS